MAGRWKRVASARLLLPLLARHRETAGDSSLAIISQLQTQVNSRSVRGPVNNVSGRSGTNGLGLVVEVPQPVGPVDRRRAIQRVRDLAITGRLHGLGFHGGNPDTPVVAGLERLR